jgi:hypothetical protein
MNEELNREDAVNAFLAAGDIDAAEKYAASIEEDWQRAESLAIIARSCSMSRDLIGACRIWRSAVAAAETGQESLSIQDSLDASSVLSEIAENIASAGDGEYARRVAKCVKYEHRRERTIASVERILRGEIGCFRA